MLAAFYQACLPSATFFYVYTTHFLHSSSSSNRALAHTHTNSFHRFFNKVHKVSRRPSSKVTCCTEWFGCHSFLQNTGSTWIQPVSSIMMRRKDLKKHAAKRNRGCHLFYLHRSLNVRSANKLLQCWTIYIYTQTHKPVNLVADCRQQ